MSELVISRHDVDKPEPFFTDTHQGACGEKRGFDSRRLHKFFSIYQLNIILELHRSFFSSM